MSELIAHIKEYWGLIVSIIGGSWGGFVSWSRWKSAKKKQAQEKKEKEQSSTELLYKQLEELRKKVIIQVEREIQQADEIAEKEMIINTMRINCKECFERYIKAQADE